MPTRQNVRIAFVANTTWNIYNFRLNLIKALIRQGYEIIVIAPVDKYIHYLNDLEGVTHIGLDHLNRRNLNPFKDLRLLWELKRIYRRVNPDLIIHFTIKPNIYGSLGAAWNRIRSVSVITGLGYTFLHQRYLRALMSLLYRFAFRFACRVVFENKEDRDLFVHRSWISANKAKHIRGCGVDTRYFHPTSHGEPRSEPIFAFIGRLLLDKGIGEFVGAARILKAKNIPAKFWVIGEIDEDNPSFVSKRKLIEWIESNTIRYFGVTDNIREFIREVDCIVLPSYREGLSKVLLEALSMAKPLITTDTAGCRETVEHGRNGFLVPVKDEEALSLAMEAFCDIGTNERNQMGQCSRKLARTKYDDHIIIRSYLKLIESVVDTKMFRRIYSDPATSPDQS